ncbi:MAG TPA: hypothetical protein VHS09_05020 [Polyangiaceae bacterium]|nr:hypothetical protein [Polyangiaceae bacterium]
MGLGLRASLAGAILAATACGTGFSASTAGDAGGDDVSVADAGGADTSVADAGSPDTAADTAPGETGTPDAPSPSEAGGAPFCTANTGKYTFCEDFDEYASIGAFLGTWIGSGIGGTFSFDQSGVPSAPNALHVLTTSTSGVRNLAFHPVQAAAGASTTSQRLEFQLRINQAKGIDAFSAAAVAAIVFGKDVSYGAVALAFSSGTGSNPAALSAVFLGPAPDSGIPVFGTANGPPPFPTLGQWDGRFALEIDYGPATDAGPTACAQIYVGTFPQLTPCLVLPPSLSHPLQTSIALGVYSGGVGNTGTVDVEFDNVTYNAL